jgi:hypothetical protein
VATAQADSHISAGNDAYPQAFETGDAWVVGDVKTCDGCATALVGLLATTTV